ncbi:RNA polymerase sigma factor [Nocardiopsis alba]|uniref:RNA polymerase sigma factor n=1 Tax=Nocardiopsis alba TaxID=53437 RepID=UPI00340D691A
MVDLLRAERARARREREVVVADPALRGPGASVSEVDDGLALSFLCCHPSLSVTSQVALTLRAVGGLTTAQIAHAHGVDEATMGTRIGRAKRRSAEAGARFTLPVGDRAARAVAVMRVLYLVFNEGYTASAGEELSRVDLMAEAIRSARMLRAALPEEAEAAGLLAMMLLLWSRRAARTGADGVLVPLKEQDRSLWDVEAIEEGRALLDGVWNRGEAGRYQVEAAIAAVHASSEVADRAGPVRLARVVAVARAYGAERGLTLLDELGRRHRWGMIRWSVGVSVWCAPICRRWSGTPMPPRSSIGRPPRWAPIGWRDVICWSVPIVCAEVGRGRPRVRVERGAAVVFGWGGRSCVSTGATRASIPPSGRTARSCVNRRWWKGRRVRRIRPGCGGSRRAGWSR